MNSDEIKYGEEDQLSRESIDMANDVANAIDKSPPGTTQLRSRLLSAVDLQKIAGTGYRDFVFWLMGNSQKRFHAFDVDKDVRISKI